MAAEIDYSRFVSIEDIKPQWKRMNKIAIDWYLAESSSVKLTCRNKLFEELYSYYGIIGDGCSDRLFEDDEESQKDADDIWADEKSVSEAKRKASQYGEVQARKEAREKEIMAFLCGMDGSTYVPLEHFNPEEYTFSHYYHLKRKNLAVDILRKESGAYQKKLSEEERRQRQEEKIRNGDSSPVPESAYIYPDTSTSVDDYEQILETDEDSNASKGAQLRSVEDDVSYYEEIEYKISVLISTALNAQQILGRKKGNPTRCTYYRTFFTSDISRAIRETERLDIYKRQESQLFRTVLVTFLDFTLRDICRTVPEIHASCLKQYCEMVPDAGNKYVYTAKGEENLGADVYCTFLREIEGIPTASEVAVSVNRKSYDEFVGMALRRE